VVKGSLGVTDEELLRASLAALVYRRIQ